MTVEQFRKQWKKQPFQPFVAKMADGSSFEVKHPDFVAMSPTGRTVVIYDEDDTSSVLDLLLMTELQMKAHNQN